MAKYFYKAINKTGKRISGTREAASKEDILRSLMASGYTPLQISESIGIDWKKLASTDIGGVPLTEKVILMKQLATMVSSSIPILQALDILTQQTEKAALKEKLGNIYKSVEGGSTLADAFSKESGILSEVQINLIAAGEKSGNLNDMLIRVAVDMQKSKELRGKIVGALIYPIIIFVILLVVLLLMIVVLVPQIEELFRTLDPNAKLPAITQFLVSLGNSFRNPVFIASTIILIGFSYLGFRYYNSTSSGKFLIDKLKLKIPVFGMLTKKIELVQFTRLTSMMLSSGIPIIEAISVVSRALGNETFRVIVRKSVEDIKKGSSLSVSLAKNNNDESFPLILLRIMATGEESGKIEKVLNDMSEFYENEVNETTSNLTKILEPFMLVIVGGMVAFLAVAVYLPIYQVGDIIQQ